MGTTSSSKTMADGTLRVTIDLNPGDAVGAFTAFGAPGSAVAVARLTDTVAVEANRPGKPAKGPFGKYAQALVRSGFFRVPDVWENVGTDEEYLEWVRKQKSACSGERDLDPDTGELYCVAAHVRHVEHGSGTAIKPSYSAIPLTDMEHRTAHQNGDSTIGPREWWDKERVKYVSQWAYETLKKNLNYESYTDIAPHKIRSWCEFRGLERYLPNEFYTEAEDGEATESQAAG